MTAAQPSSEDLERLEALGYAETVSRDPQRDASGVVLHDPRAYSGLNLFNSRLHSAARLIDMRGCVLHTWSHPNLKGGWHHTELLPTGELAVVAKDNYLALLDASSTLLWKHDVAAHHDVAFLPDGNVMALVWEERNVQSEDEPLVVRDEFLVTYSLQGEEVARVSLWGVLKSFVPAAKQKLLQRLTKRGQLKPWARVRDVFHINALHVLERPLRDVPQSAAGQVLLTVRNLDLVVLVDPAARRVVWSSRAGWTHPNAPRLDRPHHATRVGERLLVFDNGVKRKASRVVEVSFLGEEVWSFPGGAGLELFSRTRGAAQKLPNGNVLITESNAGHVLEVTENKEVVWRFWNTDRDPETDERGAVYRMTRVEAPRWLKGAGDQVGCRNIVDQ